MIEVLGILLGIIGVYYAREQFLAQRQEKLGKIMVVASNGTVANEALSRIKLSKRIRVGCLWYPPFVEYEIRDGSVLASGFYPDILMALFLGIHVNIIMIAAQVVVHYIFD